MVGKGESERSFSIHKGVLCNHSTFFRAAVAGNFQEAKSNVVHLPDADPEAFSTYAQWAYSGQIIELDPDEDGTNGKRNFRVQVLRCKLYILAEYLGDTLLQNTITDLIVQDFKKTTKGPGVAVIRLVYQQTRDNSNLRKLMLDWHLKSTNGDWLQTYRKRLPPAFLADLAIEWAKVNLDRRAVNDPKTAWKCTYHDHDSTVPVCQ